MGSNIAEVDKNKNIERDWLAQQMQSDASWLEFKSSHAALLSLGTKLKLWRYRGTFKEVLRTYEVSNIVLHSLKGLSVTLVCTDDESVPPVLIDGKPTRIHFDEQHCFAWTSPFPKVKYVPTDSAGDKSARRLVVQVKFKFAVNPTCQAESVLYLHTPREL